MRCHFQLHTREAMIRLGVGNIDGGSKNEKSFIKGSIADLKYCCQQDPAFGDLGRRLQLHIEMVEIH